MKNLNSFFRSGAGICVCLCGAHLMAQNADTLAEDSGRATISFQQAGDLRTYTLTTTAELRDHRPPEKRVVFSETSDHATLRTGSVMFDGLYALAIHEATLNSVSQIKDNAYGKGTPIQLEAFQTGEFWTYVWTRDLAYSANLALAGFDPARAVNSLLFKTSVLKPSVTGGFRNQIIQDTGSGGSYPVSSDRVVWALGAAETLNFLPEDQQPEFLRQIYPILQDTIEQDRRLVFDPQDGLYRGEQSFLDWREQTYPGWTRDNVLPIAMSKALSVNVLDYFALQTAAACAGRLGRPADQKRYAQWAGELKPAINRRFYDAGAGLYSTCLFSDGGPAVRVHRYDLLGESLAILLGVADHSQAEAIMKNYPVGPHGPPVVWPEEPTVPIYHNQAIWPFVTAYWIKAARQAGNVAAVDHGIRSLEQAAALNLSNMENYDFVTGRPEVKNARLNGPVINSRRQLWSVAGYLSMVQDVVFGLETSPQGIRFRPFVTAQLRRETLTNSDVMELRNFNYQGAQILVRVHLPPVASVGAGVCPPGRMELNGVRLGNGFVPRTALKPSNQWDIYLNAPKPSKHPATLQLVDVTSEQARFGPLPPEWGEAGQGGITVEAGRLALHYRHSDAASVLFNIYRDGRLCAKSVSETNWLDPGSGDYRTRLHYYVIEAVDPASRNASHLTPSRFYLNDGQSWEIPARDMEHVGGNLVAGHHYENWGKPGDTLSANFQVKRGGRCVLRAEFSNGAGPVNTGITCAVKKLEIVRAGSEAVVASGYLVMPQSGDWRRWDLSSPVTVELPAGGEYRLRLAEDEYCRNMSCLNNNARYTAWPGGGDAEYDFVNIAALQVVQTTGVFR